MRSAEFHRCLARFAKFIPSTVPQPFTDGRQLGNCEICATPKTPPNSERAIATPDVNTQTWSCLPSTYTSSPRGARAPLPPSHSPEQRFVPPVHSGNGGKQLRALERGSMYTGNVWGCLPSTHIPHSPLGARSPSHPATLVRQTTHVHKSCERVCMFLHTVEVGAVAGLLQIRNEAGRWWILASARRSGKGETYRCERVR